MNMILSLITKLVFVSFFLLSGCGKKDSLVSDVVKDTAVFTHFTFYYTKYDADKIADINLLLEDNYTKILSHHGLNQIQRVSFYFFENIAQLRDKVHEKYPNINIPDYASGLTPSATEVYLISQNLPGMNSNYKDIVHEFAHCVSQHLNAGISNNPRWLWESVAIYESNQFIHPNTISYMTAHTPPSLDELNSYSNTRIYQVGYLLAEFIIDKWGLVKYRDMVVNNGNIQLVLGISKTDFEQQWFEFVKNKYNI